VKPKVPISEKGIVARLINWGLCYFGRGGGAMSTKETRRVSPYGGQGYVCMTAVACNKMREAANGPKGGRVQQSRLDFQDAAKIERAWTQIGVRHQLILRDLYVLGKSVNTICRQLNIRHTPGIHWNTELAMALDAIEDIVDGGNK
jgi:hypothetical protein